MEKLIACQELAEIFVNETIVEVFKASLGWVGHVSRINDNRTVKHNIK